MRAASKVQELLGDSQKIRGATVRSASNGMVVEFDSRRSHLVACEESTTHVLLESIAVRQVQGWIKQKQLNELILRSNHALPLVGLRRKGEALTVFAKLLKSRLDRDEAVYAIVAVAREADRLEYLLTGKDEI